MEIITIKIGTQAIIEFADCQPELYHFIGEVPCGYIIKNDKSGKLGAISDIDIAIKLAFGKLAIYNPITDSEFNQLLNETIHKTP